MNPGDEITGGPFKSTAMFLASCAPRMPDCMWVWTARHGVHKVLCVGWKRRGAQGSGDPELKLLLQRALERLCP